MKNTSHNEAQTITLGKLCEALANGHLPAQLEDDMYVIRNNDLRRLLRASMTELAFRSKLTRVYTQKAS